MESIEVTDSTRLWWTPKRDHDNMIWQGKLLIALSPLCPPFLAPLKWKWFTLTCIQHVGPDVCHPWCTAALEQVCQLISDKIHNHSDSCDKFCACFNTNIHTYLRVLNSDGTRSAWVLSVKPTINTKPNRRANSVLWLRFHPWLPSTMASAQKHNNVEKITKYFSFMSVS